MKVSDKKLRDPTVISFESIPAFDRHGYKITTTGGKTIRSRGGEAFKD